MEQKSKLNELIEKPPVRFAILAMLGPSYVWCSEFIGSGEVILATRSGAILGPSITWVIVIGIFLKYWIGMSGARYTVCTGEGMIDMFDRIPGPKHSVVWIVLVAQFVSGMISIGSIASAAAIFVSNITNISPIIAGWVITIFSIGVVWTGVFNILKIFMSIFVLIIIIGVLYVASTVFPGLSEFLKGFLMHVPEVPDWALSVGGVSSNPWREILPLMGWAAGGFASQVWYTYWVLGAGYGVAKGRNYGEPADVSALKSLTKKGAQKIKGWCRVVYIDASIAMIIGIVVTLGFMLAGAGVLGPLHLAPQGEMVAITLANVFSNRWGELGGFLFMLSGVAALIGTQIGQLAGWPRLLADAFRICIPNFEKRFSWKIQFRIFLIFFLCTNMIIVFSLGLKPVFLVQISAILDGLLLTPLQALWVALGLYIVMPKILSKEAWQILKPHWIFAFGLLIAFLVFGYFCIFQMPFIF